MIEVVVVSAASGAFNAIKKGFEMGRDIRSMSKDLGGWIGLCPTLRRQKNTTGDPPLFKKLFASGSVEEEVMEIL